MLVSYVVTVCILSSNVNLCCIAYNTLRSKIDFRQILVALKDPKSWALASINAGVALGISSVGSFLPTFIKAYGFSAGR